MTLICLLENNNNNYRIEEIMTLYDEIEDTRTTKKTYQMKLNNWQWIINNIYLNVVNEEDILSILY